MSTQSTYQQPLPKNKAFVDAQDTFLAELQEEVARLRGQERQYNQVQAHFRYLQQQYQQVES